MVLSVANYQHLKPVIDRWIFFISIVWASEKRWNELSFFFSRQSLLKIGKDKERERKKTTVGEQVSFLCLNLYQNQDVGGRKTDLGHMEDILECPIFYLSYLRLLDLMFFSSELLSTTWGMPC